MLDLSPGTVLENRYTILRPLGQGGMGAVYLAQDGRLNQRCAVKMALHTGPDAEAQFRREAALLAGLHHLNLPRVTDYFTHDNRYFLVMDYVRGQNFHEIVRGQGAQPESRVLRWLPQILDALEYLHNHRPQPIIHRDIKPANLKLTPDGQVMLVDFGIAKRYDPQMRTITGAQAVSPGFSSPEQYGRGFTDARSDIYSLGATLYYLLTGVAPAESLDRITGVAELTSPRQRNLRVSPVMEHVILKAMALNRNKRFASVQELREALPAAEITTPVGPQKKRPTIDLLVPIIAVVALLLVVGLLAVGAWGLAGRFLSGSPTQVARATATATPFETVVPPESTQPGHPAASATPQSQVAGPEPAREPTATLRSVASSTPAGLYPAPELISPKAGDSIIGPATFEWEWTGKLKPNEAFDLHVWRLDKPEVSVGQPRETTHRMSAPPDGAGMYQWRVVVVQKRLTDDQIIVVSKVPAPIVLDFWRGGAAAPTATLRPPGQALYLYPAPELISPKAGDSIIGPATFEWTWAGTLQDNEFFDVHVWRLDTPESSVKRTRDIEYRMEKPPNGAGKYQWRVVVVQKRLADDQIIVVSEMPAPIVLDFWRGPSRGASTSPTSTPVPPTNTPVPPTNTPAPHGYPTP